MCRSYISFFACDSLIFLMFDVDLVHEILECLVNVDVIFCTCLHVCHSVQLSESSSLTGLDLSLFSQVTLVSNQNKDCFGIAMFFCIGNPVIASFMQVRFISFKRLSIVQRKAYDDSLCIPLINLSKGLKFIHLT